jgi:Fe-Mn family superoxide dismutase
MDKDCVQQNHCGFSRELLNEHYMHYPAVQQNKLKEIEARLIKADINMANSNFCPLRSLEIERTYAINSVKMHKYFFENISQEAGAQPSSEITGMIDRDFGSLEEWEKQFFALAKCSRGWVVLGFDLEYGSLRNFFLDSNSEGVWAVLPLLVLDVYEHAYCTTFSSRNDYIIEFLGHVKWTEVSRRLKVAKNMHRIMNEN